MKTRGLFLLLLAAWANSVFAQPITIDENGHGTNSILGAQPGFPVPFHVGPDPSGGIGNVPVLMYSLGYRVYAGDVLLVGANGRASDLIRFYTPAGNTNFSLIIFYSDNDGDGDLADVGFPHSVAPLVFNENNADPWWRPASGQPGAPLPGQVFPVGAIFWYQFISDVPEPQVGLWMLAGVGMLLRRRRPRTFG